MITSQPAAAPPPSPPPWPMPPDWTADAQPWCCTNCGFWQRRPDPPRDCPLCLDPRHAPPVRGFDHRTADRLAPHVRTEVDEVEPGLWRFATVPQLGIGGSGYLLVRPGGGARGEPGNVAFEACGFYDDAALRRIDALGGVAWAAASHPHTYGGLWQLQQRYGCEVAIQVDDLWWTGAFRTTWPYDEALAVGGSDGGGALSLHRTGGHFPGHAVLHDAERRILLCGDAFKLDLTADDPRVAEAISTHKGFVREIPLTAGELRRYREVVAALDFDQVWTPFEQGRNVARAHTLALLDRLLATRPTIRPVPLADLGVEPLPAGAPR